MIAKIVVMMPVIMLAMAMVVVNTFRKIAIANFHSLAKLHWMETSLKSDLGGASFNEHK